MKSFRHVVFDFSPRHIFELVDYAFDRRLDFFVPVVDVVDQERHQVVDEQQIPVLNLVDQLVHKLENRFVDMWLIQTQQ